MADRDPSYVLAAALRVDGDTALRDEQGRRHKWVPCMDDPIAWDEDVPRNVQQRAAEICLRDCPAIAACAARRAQLGDQAIGVWAGQIITSMPRNLQRQRPFQRLPDLPPDRRLLVV